VLLYFESGHGSCYISALRSTSELPSGCLLHVSGITSCLVVVIVVAVLVHVVVVVAGGGVFALAVGFVMK
jgi:hypothetical protein